jgi:hypothetical protein
MGKYDKLFNTILLGTSDSNISFNDLCQLMFRLGFEERVNLQKDGNKAKIYQVKQIRNLIIKYKLTIE